MEKAKEESIGECWATKVAPQEGRGGGRGINLRGRGNTAGVLLLLNLLLSLN